MRSIGLFDTGAAFIERRFDKQSVSSAGQHRKYLAVHGLDVLLFCPLYIALNALEVQVLC